MSDRVRDVMTSHPMLVRRTTSVLDAAQAMAAANIGPVLVVDCDGALCGVVTHRDIVVRGVAPGRRLGSTAVDEICTAEVATASPSDSVADAIHRMREHAVRRLPVVESDKPVGMVALGDLVVRTDAVIASEVHATLAASSAAPQDDRSAETHPNVAATLSPDRDLPNMPSGGALVWNVTKRPREGR